MERLVAIGFLLLACLALSAFQCQTRGCSPNIPSRMVFAPDLLPFFNTLRAAPTGQIADMWLEIGDTGVFTPSLSGGNTVVTTDDGQVIPFLDDLATRGYIAIRVPHAPPTYTLSSLLPGIPPSAPDPVTFSYHSPPSASVLTSVVVTVTRRADLEAIVNARYPIADGQSHWEVWWLPEGEEFPIPEQPFRLEAGDWPPPLALSFRVDFGGGSDARDCAGCPVEVLVYNGYVFMGPFPFALRYDDPALRDPLVSFGPHCGYEEESLAGTIGQYITSTVPFTHVHCLENWDDVARTFTVNTSSSQGWDYTYYSRETDFGAPLVPLGDPPFIVEVDPFGSPFPGCLGLLAVHTPTVAVTDTLREMFTISATSTVSPTTVWARSVSVALAPGYRLNEGGGFRIYLPLLLRLR